MDEQIVINPLVHPTVHAELRPLVLEGTGVFGMPRNWLQRRDPLQVAALTPQLRRGCIAVAKQLVKISPYGVHIANAHLHPVVQARVNALLDFNLQEYHCTHCAIIPEDERYILPLNDDPPLIPIPFMAHLSLMTMCCQTDFQDYVWVMIMENSTSCGFPTLVFPDESIADTIIGTLEKLFEWTNIRPATLTFTTRHGMNLNSPIDPIVVYLRQHNIVPIHLEPMVRLPSGGLVNIRMYFDNVVRALTKQFGRDWRAHTTYAFSTWDRLIDSDGLTPSAKFYHRIDARLTLDYYRWYRVEHDGVQLTAKFIAFDTNLTSYTFRKTNGTYFSTQLVANQRPLPNNQQPRRNDQPNRVQQHQRRDRSNERHRRDDRIEEPHRQMFFEDRRRERSRSRDRARRSPSPHTPPGTPPRMQRDNLEDGELPDPPMDIVRAANVPHQQVPIMVHQVLEQVDEMEVDQNVIADQQQVDQNMIDDQHRVDQNLIAAQHQVGQNEIDDQQADQNVVANQHQADQNVVIDQPGQNENIDQLQAVQNENVEQHQPVQNEIADQHEADQDEQRQQINPLHQLAALLQDNNREQQQLEQQAEPELPPKQHYNEDALPELLRQENAERVREDVRLNEEIDKEVENILGQAIENAADAQLDENANVIVGKEIDDKQEDEELDALFDRAKLAAMTAQLKGRSKEDEARQDDQ